MTEFKHKKLIKFSLEKDSHCFITLHQQDARLFDERYTYSYFRVTIAKVEAGRVSYVATKFECKRNVVFENILTRGDYIVLIEPFLYTSKNITYTISSYGSGFVFFEEEADGKSKEHDRIELLVWKDFCSRNSQLLNSKHNVKIVETEFAM